jgi:uncharacterized glyoxalase superfamily protein PhnB
LFVRDYDEALKFYTEKLGFQKVADEKLAPGIRWVAVAPTKKSETIIVFEKATRKAEIQAVGKQLTNMLIQLETDNLDETCEALRKQGVEFIEEPQVAPWGKQAVFKDLYGNLFDLLEVAKS